MATKGRGKLTTTPKLASLPPTTEVFNLNVLRAHYQACIWNHCMSSTPPDLNPCDFGWKKDNVNECLKVQMYPEGVSPLPIAVLKRFSCNCSSNKPCVRCSCTTSNISCSKFCACYQGECFNKLTIREDNDDDESSDEEDSEEEGDN